MLKGTAHAVVLVVSPNVYRIAILIEALGQSGVEAIGAWTLDGIHHAFHTCPYLQHVAILRGKDLLDPFECVLMEVKGATLANFNQLCELGGFQQDVPAQAPLAA